MDKEVQTKIFSATGHRRPSYQIETTSACWPSSCCCCRARHRISPSKPHSMPSSSSTATRNHRHVCRRSGPARNRPRQHHSGAVWSGRRLADETTLLVNPVRRGCCWPAVHLRLLPRRRHRRIIAWGPPCVLRKQVWSPGALWSSFSPRHPSGFFVSFFFIVFLSFLSSSVIPPHTFLFLYTFFSRNSSATVVQSARF